MFFSDHMSQSLIHNLDDVLEDCQLFQIQIAEDLSHQKPETTLW